jgi:hypothetical protein
VDQRREQREKREARDDLVFVIITLMLVYYITALRFAVAVITDK